MNAKPAIRRDTYTSQTISGPRVHWGLWVGDKKVPCESFSYALQALEMYYADPFFAKAWDLYGFPLRDACHSS